MIGIAGIVNVSFREAPVGEHLARIAIIESLYFDLTHVEDVAFFQLYPVSNRGLRFVELGRGKYFYHDVTACAVELGNAIEVGLELYGVGGLPSLQMDQGLQ